MEQQHECMEQHQAWASKFDHRLASRKGSARAEISYNKNRRNSQIMVASSRTKGNQGYVQKPKENFGHKSFTKDIPVKHDG